MNYSSNCQKKWSTWSSLLCEYKVGLDNVVVAQKQQENIADREILGNLKNDTQRTLKTIKNKCLYDKLNVLADEEILNAGLTKNQKIIAKFRQNKYSYADIARITGLCKNTVFMIYEQVLKKVEKYKKAKLMRIPVGLSRQQVKIYTMYFKENKSKIDIAKELKISDNSVKTQLRRIKNKIGG